MKIEYLLIEKHVVRDLVLSGKMKPGRKLDDLVHARAVEEAERRGALRSIGDGLTMWEHAMTVSLKDGICEVTVEIDGYETLVVEVNSDTHFFEVPLCELVVGAKVSVKVTDANGAADTRSAKHLGPFVK